MLKGFVCVHKNITILLFRVRFGNTYFLKPTMGTRNGIRIRRMGNVLMNTTIPPPYTFSIWIICFPRFDPHYRFHLPLAITHILNVHSVGHKTVTFILLAAPPTNMVRAGDHAGFDGFRHPDLIHEPANLSGYFQQVTIIHTKTCSILGMDPDWISMGNLGEPFGIGRP